MHHVLSLWTIILSIWIDRLPFFSPLPLGELKGEGLRRRNRTSRYPAVVIGLGLFVGLVTTAWSIDPELQQAQERLSKLGYALGVPDGVYGPRTRQALEAFQRTQKLPVSGNLDAATLQALERLTIPAQEPPVSEAELPDAPVRVVVDFLSAYARQPSRALPYVSEQFFQGITASAWIENTEQTRHEQAYTYLAWQVKHLEMQEENTRAVVTVDSRVRIKAEAQLQQEQFTLHKTPDGVWLIDQWQVGAPPAAPPTSAAGS